MAQPFPNNILGETASGMTEMFPKLLALHQGKAQEGRAIRVVKRMVQRPRIRLKATMPLLQIRWEVSLFAGAAGDCH